MDAETTPLRQPEHYQYEFNLADISEVWRRGSVIASWLLDLTAAELATDPGLAKFAGRVSDSGEGRWTIKAAIDEGVPVPVLTTALYGAILIAWRCRLRRQTAFRDAFWFRRSLGENATPGSVKSINERCTCVFISYDKVGNGLGIRTASYDSPGYSRC